MNGNAFDAGWSRRRYDYYMPMAALFSTATDADSLLMRRGELTALRYVLPRKVWRRRQQPTSSHVMAPLFCRRRTRLICQISRHGAATLANSHRAMLAPAK